MPGGDGRGKASIIVVAALVDTNILLYRSDPRFPEKQEIATDHRGNREDSIRVPHQAIIEFLPSRPAGGFAVVEIRSPKRSPWNFE
jgi:hypothetical protein